MGEKLGEHKGDYKGPWDLWSKKMQDYCEQDTTVNLVIYNEIVPLMDNVKELSSAGSVPKGAKNNLDFCSKGTTFAKGISKGRRLALSDPQTSGGLLISLPPGGIATFDRIMKKNNLPYWTIGEVRKGRGKIVVE